VFGPALLFLLGLLLAGWLGVAVTLRTLTRPPRRTFSWAIARGRPSDPSELPTPHAFREWTFASRGLTLPVWDVTGEDPAGPVIVLTHGWGDSRVTMLERADALAPLASRLILWDMPGHGDAPGLCTLGTHEADDLLALLAAINPAQPLVLFGFSLGAGVTLAAARTLSPTPSAVIVEAPYRFARTPATNVLRMKGMPYRWNLPIALTWLRLHASGPRLTDPTFDRATHAAALRSPLLLIHTRHDAVCPFADSEAIAAVRPADLVTTLLPLAVGGHADLWSDPDARAAMLAAVRDFLTNPPAAPRPPAG
jgi:pimeloyl-ACP methyl ester carboxylesterase